MYRYAAYIRNLQNRWRHSHVLVLKGFITPPLRNYPLEVVPSTRMWCIRFNIMLYYNWLWCGLCRDVFWIFCHWRGVPCGVDDHFAQTLSCCMCPFGTLAVDAPLAGCKRTVWASLGPTHRYFIDVWQQGQWANAPAGDEAAVSWMMCSSAWSGSGSVRLESLESTSILWAGKGRPSQDVGLWWIFCISSMSLCVWLALHVDDRSLLGLCVFSPRLCHQTSVL